MITRFTHAEVKKYIEIESNSGCKLLSDSYINNWTKLLLKCKCGVDFHITLTNFKGSKSKPSKTFCNKCGKSHKIKQLTFDYEDVKRFIEIDSESGCTLLSKEYIKSEQKLVMQCQCGEKFETNFRSFKHRNKRQCNLCGRKRSALSKEMNFEEIVNYISKNCDHKIIMTEEQFLQIKQTLNTVPSKVPIELLCSCGNEYKTTYMAFSQGKNRFCRNCIRTRVTADQRSEHNDFIQKLIQSDKNVFDYLEIKGTYIKNNTPILCKCKICDSEWDTTIPSSLLSGSRCPRCKQPKGESRIQDYLKNRNIEHKPQYKFDKCKHEATLSFDFAIIKNNDVKCLIEFDGGQHFFSVDWYGGEEGFRKTKIRDEIKNTYCKQNNLPLIRIPHWEFDKIEKILDEEFSRLKII